MSMRSSKSSLMRLKRPKMWNTHGRTLYNQNIGLNSLFALSIPFFQQFTGINVIMFYAPVLFKTLGFGSDTSLMSSVITGGVNVVAIVVSIFSVDKFGRRILFLKGGIQMLVCRLAVGTMIAMKFGVSGEGSFTNGEASLLLFFICAYVAAYAWSWGPLGWLVPSEICSLEVRSAVWPFLLLCWICAYHDHFCRLVPTRDKERPN
ncbi:unnamed protein product [Sphenostylis stenocarpa]|uniref:Major facilitator superfamily (MFS) profile domain-containing protein n=1 Tax=Sphenostylis stenocarpa TaxID=92480 RepID=A0AA86T2H5_9FABA|nr:unnamed protein product [Sphenostylis stenocarpa]